MFLFLVLLMALEADGETSSLYGTPFHVHPKGDRISDTIRKDGAWEPDLVASICDELREYTQPTFLDIGGNIGAVAIGVAQCAPHATVWAVEAAPWNFELLQKNAEMVCV